ncbi:hypothetical protein BGZ98_000647 [Dissophora globulifera]|nr:hypothetical protein BGZ98_000647 [Dissophora globulifera]
MTYPKPVSVDPMHLLAYGESLPLNDSKRQPFLEMISLLYPELQSLMKQKGLPTSNLPPLPDAPHTLALFSLRPPSPKTSCRVFVLTVDDSTMRELLEQQKTEFEVGVVHRKRVRAGNFGNPPKQTPDPLANTAVNSQDDDDELGPALEGKHIVDKILDDYNVLLDKTTREAQYENWIVAVYTQRAPATNSSAVVTAWSGYVDEFLELQALHDFVNFEVSQGRASMDFEPIRYSRQQRQRSTYKRVY